MIDSNAFTYDEGHTTTKALLDDFDPSGIASAAYDAVIKLSHNHIKPIAQEFDRKAVFPFHLWKILGDAGLPGITVAEEYGGTNFPYLAQGAAIEAISRDSGSIGLSHLANSVLCIHQIATWANHNQKIKHLPKLCDGTHHGAICITEPDYGSDAKGIQMKAERVKGGWLLNGSKTMITNGGTANVLVAYAKTGVIEPNHLSAFIIDRAFPQEKENTITAKKLDKGGMRASETWEMYFTDHFVPDEDLLGEEGDGLYIMFSGLPIEREMLATQSIGLSEESYRKTVKHLSERKQFGKPLIQQPVIKHQLADMYREITVARTQIYSDLTRAQKGKHLPTRKERYEFLKNKDGFFAKNTAAEMGVKITVQCVTICGSTGYMTDTGLMRNHADAILNTIGGGANNICNLSSWKDLGYNG